MNPPLLPDVSGITRLLIALGLVTGVAAHVIGRMVGRRGRDGLPMQLLRIAAISVFAGVFLVAKPEWGGACAKFLYEKVLEPIIAQSSATAAPTPRR